MSGGFSIIKTDRVQVLHPLAYKAAVKAGLPLPRPEDETGNDYDVAEGDQRGWTVDTHDRLFLYVNDGARNWSWNGTRWQEE